jgi:DNA-directed RNA polymerase subunit RPC12/RpoP
MYSTGQKPGNGIYQCTKCGQIVRLDDNSDTLPPCPKCENTTYWKIGCAHIASHICVKLGIDKNLSLARQWANHAKVHHVRKLKGLTGKNEWEEKMIQMNRKTLVVCDTCFEKITGK